MRIFYLLLLVSLSASLAKSAVIATEVGQRGELVLIGNEVIPIDFDGDGVIELTVEFSEGSDVRAITNGNTRIVAIPATPPDVGSSVFNFPEGVVIDETLPSNSLEYFSGRGGLLSCRTIGCIGLWGGGTHFLGVEFEMRGENHYGYVEVDIPFEFLAAGQVLSYAYETSPQGAIRAGAVPEPSVFALLAGGFLISLRRNRH